MLSLINWNENYDFCLKEKGSKGELIRNKNYYQLITLIENLIPNRLFLSYPETLYYLYKCFYLTLEKDGQLKTAEEIYEKFLYPVYLKYKNKVKTNSSIKRSKKKYTLKKSINEKISSCIKKIANLISLVKNLNLKKISLEEDSENKMNVENELDIELIHNEIIKNIHLNSSDSEISQMEDDYNLFKGESESDIENIKETKENDNRIFNISKCERIIPKSTCDKLNRCQYNEIFNPFSDINLNLNHENPNNSNFDITKNNVISKESLFECNALSQNININLNNKNLNENGETTVVDNANDSHPLENKKKQSNNPEIPSYIINDPSSNYNKFSTHYILKDKKRNKLRDLNPFLKTFKPKFLKRENIDKKIFRQFRNYILIQYKEKGENYFYNLDKEFYKSFFEKNLLPPIKISDPATGRNYHFRSFNSKYFIWLFKKNGMFELYEDFVYSKGNFLIESFKSEYDIKEIQEEKNFMENFRTYIFNIHHFYMNLIEKSSKKINIINDSNLIKTNNSNSSIIISNSKSCSYADCVDKFMEKESIKSLNIFDIKFDDEMDKQRNNECEYSCCGRMGECEDSFSSRFLLNSKKIFEEDVKDYCIGNNINDFFNAQF